MASPSRTCLGKLAQEGASLIRPSSVDVVVWHPHAAHTPKWCPLPIGDGHVEEIGVKDGLGGEERGGGQGKTSRQMLGEGQALTPRAT